ncbi:MAG TPA: LLM class F420-dependent oxidoreductase [Acidimicrobiales bacterium]
MDFGLHLGTINPKGWLTSAEEADRLGFESLWVPEHVVVPLTAAGSPHAGSDHPPIPSNIPIYDVFAVLGMIAARTERINLGTNVYNIGLRHPFMTARAATTVDVFSGGRMLLGIGSSWLEAEWDAIGLDFATRGRRVDEAIDVCRRLWTEEVIEHHGEFFDFGPTNFEPKPVRPGGVALHIGGDGAAALRRAATVGAGWMPMNHSLEQMPADIARITQMATDAGRTDPIQISMSGTIESLADVERYAEAGVTRVVCSPWASSREAIDGMRRFADEVLEPAKSLA